MLDFLPLIIIEQKFRYKPMSGCLESNRRSVLDVNSDQTNYSSCTLNAA